MAHAHSGARGESGLNGPWRALQCFCEPGLLCLVMSLVYCILGYISDCECCDDAMILFSVFSVFSVFVCLCVCVFVCLCVCVFVCVYLSLCVYLGGRDKERELRAAMC
jgi:hypothetical protein